MDVNTAANFVASTFLFMLGLIIITIGVVIVNNIIYKFWKSFGWRNPFTMFTEPSRVVFMTPEEERKYFGLQSKDSDKTV